MASVVQVKESAVYTGTPTVSRSTGNFASSCTAGNWILAFGSVPTGGGVSVAFSDTLSTNYSTVIASIKNGTTFIQIDAVIGKLTASGTNAVTYTAVGDDRISVMALEISGLHATTPYTATDRSGFNYQSAPTTSTDAVTSGNTPTLSSGNGILIGLGFDAQSGLGTYPSAGTGFTDHGTGWSGSAQNYRLESKAISSTSAVAATFTAASNVGHHAIAIYLQNGETAPPIRLFSPYPSIYQDQGDQDYKSELVIKRWF